MKRKLVMIPALCCDGGLYQDIRLALEDLADIVIVNPAAASFAACVDQVLAAVDGPFIALGTSFGGHVARETALAAPDRVTGLCVIGAGAGKVADPVGGAARAAALRDGRHGEIHAAFAEAISYLPGPRGSLARDRFLAMARAGNPQKDALRAEALAARVDRWAELSSIACPSLLIWGRHDAFSPAADGLRMSGLIPRARYVEIADCGHLPSLEAPEETAGALRHWLLDLG